MALKLLRSAIVIGSYYSSPFKCCNAVVYTKERYEECLEKCQEVKKLLDNCTDKNSKENSELRGTVHSYVGNCHLEMNNLDAALKNHQTDYQLAKKQYVHVC